MLRKLSDIDGLPVQQLDDFLQGQICILGIGNRFWCDDGVGSIMAEVLKSSADCSVIDGGFVPENHLERVVATKPETILMIDATDFGGKPGQSRLLYPDKVTWQGLSTHAGSLRMLAQYLQARTNAKIALLAIQPASTKSGQSLSTPVTLTANNLMETLVNLTTNSSKFICTK